jgi:hypothetical protein
LARLLDVYNRQQCQKLKTKQMDKYKQNLRIENGYVLSYNTIVAKIEGKNLIQMGWWSKTTQKHINYVAKEFNLIILIRLPKN